VRCPCGELAEAFTPTPDEITWARGKTLHEQHLLALLVRLKCYQRLGYFAKLADVLHLPQSPGAGTGRGHRLTAGEIFQAGKAWPNSTNTSGIPVAGASVTQQSFASSTVVAEENTQSATGRLAASRSRCWQVGTGLRKTAPPRLFIRTLEALVFGVTVAATTPDAAHEHEQRIHL
jgi:hypothetical protein